MEFGSNCNNKDGFCEEEEEDHHHHHHHHQVNISNNGEMGISSSSSFSSSPSSSYYRSHVVHQQQPLTDHHHQQQQQQHWGSSSQSYHNHHHPVESSVNRFHGGGGGGSSTTTYEGFNNNFSNQRHQFMDLSPRNNENIERDVGNIGSIATRDVGNIGSSSGNNEVICIEREHMFDKVVTPSDVGKLNRLVIPKQHAEKYFPLDSTANEKGLLLSFEDRSGKPWRFRYSYWNSSQSYVMTKGWSRFVKEKKLDAGDIVTFERGASELMKDRLFIDWRRRPNAPDHHHLGSLPSHLSFHNPLSFSRTVPWGRFFLPQTMSHQSGSMPPREHLHLQQLNYYDHHHHHQQQHNHLQRQSSSSTGTNTGYGYNMVNPSHPGAVYYLRSSSAASQQAHGLVQQGGVGEVPMVFDSVPVVQGKAAAKRVRLFGVNLECPIPEDVHDSSMAPLSLSPQQLPPHPHPLPPPHPHLQLRVYNGAPLPPMTTELPKRGRSSSLSFDLDI